MQTLPCCYAILFCFVWGVSKFGGSYPYRSVSALLLQGPIVSVVLCVFIVIIVATEKRLQVKRRVLIYFLNLAKEIPPCLHKLSVCHLGPSDRPQACHLIRRSTPSSINLFLVPKQILLPRAAPYQWRIHAQATTLKMWS